MQFMPLKPELYVTNFQKSLEFYTKILGFKIEYERQDPLFVFLSYQESPLMIQEIDPNEDDEFITGNFEYPLGRGINFQINTNDVQAIADSLKEHNYPLRKEIKDSWYKVGEILKGKRELLVQDPDGYLLRFSQKIGERLA
jgi:catechol 2,3-dioxygenase-like lactoylglutathione lyase family enzyme